MRKKSLIFPIILVGMLLCAAPAVHSADAPRAAANSAPAISDRELNSFVKAYVDYKRIQAQYGPALEKEKDSARKKQVEQEANAKIKRSLDANGLSPERYNQIFATVNANENLRKKVLKQVEEERRNS